MPEASKQCNATNQLCMQFPKFTISAHKFSAVCVIFCNKGLAMFKKALSKPGCSPETWHKANFPNFSPMQELYRPRQWEFDEFNQFFRTNFINLFLSLSRPVQVVKYLFPFHPFPFPPEAHAFTTSAWSKAISLPLHVKADFIFYLFFFVTKDKKNTPSNEGGVEISRTNS